MTAIKDAMTKAGIDTVRAELFSLASQALRAHSGDPAKAVPKFSNLLRRRPDLLDALALDFLCRVAADMGMPANVKVRAHKVRAHERHRPRTLKEKDAALRSH